MCLCLCFSPGTCTFLFNLFEYWHILQSLYLYFICFIIDKVCSRYISIHFLSLLTHTVAACPFLFHGSINTIDNDAVIHFVLATTRQDQAAGCHEREARFSRAEHDSLPSDSCWLQASVHLDPCQNQHDSNTGGQ